MFLNLSIEDFLLKLASGSPTPGGGTASALCGALASSLVSMVASLTVNKKGFEEKRDLFENALEKMAKSKDILLMLMDKDAEAFEKVMDAFKLPKNTQEEKDRRKEIIQESLKEAAEIPLTTMEEIKIVLECAGKVLENANPSAKSDALCAVRLCVASYKMAYENVKINLASIKTEQYKKDIQNRSDELNLEFEEILKKTGVKH